VLLFWSNKHSKYAFQFSGRERRRRGHGILVDSFSASKDHIPVADFFWNKEDREGVYRTNRSTKRGFI
jgi:hypothetical protein